MKEKGLLIKDKVYWKVVTKKYRDRSRQLLIDILGSKCAICGFSDIRALQFDHINSNGSQERKNRFATTTVMIYYYLKHIDEAKRHIQILCANCNWIKRAEMNEQPNIGKQFHNIEISPHTLRLINEIKRPRESFNETILRVFNEIEQNRNIIKNSCY